MTSQPSQTHLGSRPSFTSYYTAHCGIATDLSGQFANFIRRPDESHRENGYWRFTSLQDEQRAYANRLFTPEAVLAAVVCGHGAYEHISMRWVPGRIDTNMKSIMCGSAAHHLMQIYDMRRFLGKSMSFRDQIPVYPVHPRLRDYWNAKRTAAMSPAPSSGSLATAGPTTFLPQNSSLPSPISSSSAESQHTQSSSPLLQGGQENRTPNPGQSTATWTATRSLTKSPCMIAGASKTTPTDLAPPRPPLVAPPPPIDPVAQNLRHSSYVAAQRQVNETYSSPKAALAQLHHSPYSQVHHLQSEMGNQPGSVQHLQEPQVASDRSSPTTPIRGNLTAPPVQFRTSIAPATVPPFASSSTPLRSQSTNRPVRRKPTTKLSQPNRSTNRQNLSTSSTAPVYSAFTPYNSHRGFVSPYAPLKGNLTTPQPISLHATTNTQLELAAATKAPMALEDQAVPAPSGTRKNELDGTQRPEQLDETDEDTQHSTFDDVPSEAAQLHTAPPSSVDMPKSNQTQNAALPPHIPIDALVEPHRKIVRPHPATREGVLQTNEANTLGKATNDRSQVLPDKTPASRPVHPESRHAMSLKRAMVANNNALRQRKKLKDNSHGCAQTTFPDQVESHPTVIDMYPGLPCMDCGQDIGHKGNCYIGNLKPMDKLTMFDHRNLAESVVYFDPGPKTTHQNPPPKAKPEDPLDQLQGMANIIKNEDSYKIATELHSLPDEEMIVLWALQPSWDIEMVGDFTESSSIGRSEGGYFSSPGSSEPVC